MTDKEVLKASFIDVIKESLLRDSSFHAQMSLKAENEEEQFERISLSSKYYDALEWFNEFVNNYPE